MSRKVKYTTDFKYGLVKRVLERKESIGKICDELSINKSQLKQWVKYFKHHGIDGLKPKSIRYTIDFKLKVLKQIQKRGLSFREASLQYGIPSHGTVLKWHQIYEQEGKSGLYKKPKGRPKKMSIKKSNKASEAPLTREEILLKENESLKAELALLKKLHALTQAKKKKQ